MKKLWVLFAVLIFTGNVSAQTDTTAKQGIDTNKCYIIRISNIGFSDWAESVPLTWEEAYKWMSKGNINFPNDFTIVNICDIAARKKKTKH